MLDPPSLKRCQIYLSKEIASSGTVCFHQEDMDAYASAFLVFFGALASSWIPEHVERLVASLLASRFVARTPRVRGLMV